MYLAGLRACTPWNLCFQPTAATITSPINVMYWSPSTVLCSLLAILPSCRAASGSRLMQQCYITRLAVDCYILRQITQLITLCSVGDQRQLVQHISPVIHAIQSSYQTIPLTTVDSSTNYTHHILSYNSHCIHCTHCLCSFALYMLFV